MVRCENCSFVFHKEGLRQQIMRRRKEVSELVGTGLAPGTARGPVKIVTNAKSADCMVEIQTDEIVVTDRFEGPLTRIDACAGVITAKGDLTSDAAVFSREKGIPAVGNCSEALELLQDGKIVEIDGEVGRIWTYNELD